MGHHPNIEKVGTEEPCGSQCDYAGMDVVPIENKDQIGRGHGGKQVTPESRMPSTAANKKQDKVEG